ncbi:MAG: c-type cytochrome [Nitrospiria bacterium]
MNNLSSKNSLKWLSLIPLMLVLLLGWSPLLLADEEEIAETAPPEGEQLPADDLAAGKLIYEKLCISCHGIEGDGDGPAAILFQPKPRSFKKAEFKYRSTPRDMLPTDDDLFRAVTHGLPGTGMPDWADVLSEKKRRQVIQYIKTFSPKWAELEGTLPTITVGPEIPTSEESVKKGREQFELLGCIGCHGNQGRGDGPLALTLKNHRNDPVFPRNLSKNWLFRGGGEAKDIYKRVNTGLNGTPMPSFVDKLDNEKSWNLANYVRSLSPDRGKPERGSLIKSLRVEGAIPTDPDDPIWLEAQQSWLPMLGQISFEKRLFTPTVTDITVKSLFNNNEIGFLLIWDDRSKSKAKPAKRKRPERFSDKVAIQFSEKLEPDGVKKPYFIMGDEKLGVNLWYWVAEKNQFIESNSKGILNEEIFQDTSDISGKGYYKDGQYRVVIKRALETADKEKDIQFKIGEFYPIAFHAMDGTNGETKTQRAITPWYFVFMEPEIDKTVYFYPPVVVVVVFGLEILLQRFLRKVHKDNEQGPRNG